MYKADHKDKSFTMMHCFKKLQGCKKWDKVRDCLNEGKAGDEDGPVAPPASSADHPIGNKKTKAEKYLSSITGGLDPSLEKMIDTFSANNKERDERSHAMWVAVL